MDKVGYPEDQYCLKIVQNAHLDIGTYRNGGEWAKQAERALALHRLTHIIKVRLIQ